MKLIPTMTLGLAAMLALTLSTETWATVKLHSLISDGAVLQQGLAVPIWGTADDGEKVTVKFQGQEVSTTAQAGRWLVTLKPLQPGGPFTLTITAATTVEVKDLLVGEVWVCSGQSNMDWTLGNSSNGPAAVAAAADPELRLCKVPSVFPWTITTNALLTDVAVAWRPCRPAVAENFSGIGYFFGRDLRRTLKVPVGLIQASTGGTAIESWLNRGAYEADPTLRSLLTGPNSDKLGCCYNQMIAPLQPYGIRGVIWYQGESNCGHEAQYQKMFPALIRGWRETWQEGNFPFLFVQLAPCVNWTPGLREAQLLTLAKTTNTAMVVTTDYGEANNIHPLRKEPVGVRLALAARAIAYGEKIEYSGPVYESLKIEGRRAVLTFTHVGHGLEARGASLKGFTIAGADGQFVKATAKIEEGHVVVSSAEVTKPVAVRYGWDSVPDVNLFNKDGLPASPFRTDRLTK